MRVSKETKVYGSILMVVLALLIISIFFFNSMVEAQTINKNDKWNSTAGQFGIVGHDKAMHGVRGLINETGWREIMPEKYQKYSVLYALTFSALWELKDSYEWGAEPKDFYAEAVGVALSYGFGKLPKRTRMFITPGVAALAYFLVRVE